jgi:hypothetical protein
MGAAPEWKLSRQTFEDTLLTAATGVFTGAWKRAYGIRPFTVTAEGTFTGTVIVYGSNAITKPADSDNSRCVLGTIVNGSGAVEINGPWQWIKCASPGGISGSCDGFIFGTQEPTG